MTAEATQTMGFQTEATNEHDPCRCEGNNGRLDRDWWRCSRNVGRLAG